MRSSVAIFTSDPFSSASRVRTPDLVLASVFSACDSLVCVHPVTRVDFGVKTAAGFSAFDSLVDFPCWCVLEGHAEFLLLRLIGEGSNA